MERLIKIAGETLDKHGGGVIPEKVEKLDTTDRVEVTAFIRCLYFTELSRYAEFLRNIK